MPLTLKYYDLLINIDIILIIDIFNLSLNQQLVRTSIYLIYNHVK